LAKKNAAYDRADDRAEIAHMLNGHPYFEVMAYCASDRSDGKKLADVWKLSDIELEESLGKRSSRNRPCSSRQRRH